MSGGMYGALTAAVSLIGLALSLWIVLPAPTRLFLPLSVGTPEVSPWLAIWNLAALGLALGLGARNGWGLAWGAVAAISLSLSLYPLAQFPATHRAAAREMLTALGPSDADVVPADLKARLRSQPLAAGDLFTGISLAEVRLTRGIQFAAPDGIPLTSDLYRPPVAGQYPAVVIVYGGAWRSGQPQDNSSLARYLAAQGYAVWTISYRHAPSHRFPAQLQDVEAALEFIQTHAQEYDSDPQRVALLGKSAGAHLAMLAAYQPRALPVRGVVNYYGPINLLNGYYDLPHPDPLDVRSVLETFLGGPPGELDNRYRQASPSHYLRPGLPPTLLIYGRKDRIVMAKFGRSLATALRADDNAAVFVEIPWADHCFDAVFSGLSNQLALYHTERFLAQVLHGD